MRDICKELIKETEKGWKETIEKALAIEQENKNLKEIITSLNAANKVYSTSSCEKGKEIKKLKEALEFYADEGSQIPPEYFNTGRPQADFTSPYRMDKGKRAREALKEVVG